MPTYQITGPGGKEYEIEGPPGATREQIIAAIKKRMPAEAEAPAAPEVTGGVELGRGLVRGTAKGIESTVGTGFNPLGIAAQAIGAATPAIEAGFRKIGAATPETEKIVAGREQLGKQIEEDRAKSWWSSPAAHVQEAVPPPTTTSGKYAESIAEAAPPAIFQPGGMLTKVITTLGVGAGGELGEEVGGPWGRFFGSFFGGLSAARAATATQRGAARLLMSTAEDNRAGAKAAIDEIQRAGLVIEPTEVQNFAQGLRADLTNRMFENVPSLGRTGFHAADRIEAANGDLATILNVHSNLGALKPQGSDYVAALIARDAIREWVENLQPNQIIHGDPQYIAQLWEFHRDTWRIQSNLELLRDAERSAELRRLASGTGANLNTMRQEIRKIIDNDNKARRYSPEARAEMLRLVEGSFIRNLIRRGSKFAPQHGALASLPTLAAHAGGEPSLAAALGIGGTIAHWLSHLMEASSVRRLDAVIRSGSPLPGRSPLARAAQRMGVDARLMFQQAPGRWQRRGAAGARAALSTGAGSLLAEPPEPE